MISNSYSDVTESVVGMREEEAWTLRHQNEFCQDVSDRFRVGVVCDDLSMD